MIVELTSKAGEISYWETTQVTLRQLVLYLTDPLDGSLFSIGEGADEFVKAVVIDSGTVLKTYVRGDKPDTILYTLNGVTVTGEVVDNPWYEVEEEPVFGDMLTEG